MWVFGGGEGAETLPQGLVRNLSALGHGDLLSDGARRGGSTRRGRPVTPRRDRAGMAARFGAEWTGSGVAAEGGKRAGDGLGARGRGPARGGASHGSGSNRSSINLNRHGYTAEGSCYPPSPAGNPAYTA